MSLTQTVIDKTESILNDYMKNSKSFTAYDITKAVRLNLGRFIQVPHYNGVHELIEKLYNNSNLQGYTRENEEVRPGVYAWKYKPLNNNQSNVSAVDNSDPLDDLSDFLSSDDLAKRYNTSSDIDNNVNLDIDLEEDELDLDNLENKKYKYISSHNRLRIPKHIMDGAGFKAGDSVWVIFNSQDDTITIHRDKPSVSKESLARHFKVDSYGNIRIGLTKVGITAKTFELKSEPDKVSAKGI